MGAIEWLTLVLAGATVWLGWSTRDMAKATKQLAELQGQPHLSLKAVELTLGTATGPQVQAPFFNLQLRLANPGKVLVRYRVSSYDLEIHGQNIPTTSQLLNRGGVVHPGMENLFMFPTITLPHNAPSPVSGKLDLNIKFWAIPTEEHSLNATIQLVIHISPNFSYRWIYSTGPIYS